MEKFEWFSIPGALYCDTIKSLKAQPLISDQETKMTKKVNNKLLLERAGDIVHNLAS